MTEQDFWKQHLDIFESIGCLACGSNEVDKLCKLIYKAFVKIDQPVDTSCNTCSQKMICTHGLDCVSHHHRYWQPHIDKVSL